MSKPIDDGGYAFAHSGYDTPEYRVYEQQGMSLRDWFAGQALQGMLGNADSISKGVAEAVAHEMSRGRVAKTFIETAASAAFAYADAMIAARSKA